MNVCYYSPAWPPGSPPNGIATYVYHLGKGLVGLGHNFFVLSSNVHDTEGQDAHVVNLGNYSSTLRYHYSMMLDVFNNGYGMYRVEGEKIKKALRDLSTDYDIDVFEIEEAFGWSRILADNEAVFPVTRLHGPHFMMLDWNNVDAITAADHGRIRMEGLAMQAAPLITAPSQVVIDKAREFYGLDLPRACVIANPIAMQSTEDRWTLDSCDRNVLLFVGRFDRIKGADIVLHAFSVLAERYPEIELLFVGPDYGIIDSQGDTEKFGSFVNRSMSSHARARVSFLGYQTAEQIGILRRRAYATIVCSRFESFGYNVLEAMSFGSPLVSTKSGGIAEIVKDGENALTVEDLSIESMVAALDKLLGDERLATRLSNNAYRYCAARYDRALLAAKTIEVYRAAK